MKTWDGIERRQPGKTKEDDDRGRYDKYAARDEGQGRGAGAVGRVAGGEDVFYANGQAS